MKHLFNRLVSIFIAILAILAIGMVMTSRTLSSQIIGNEQIAADEGSEGGDEDSETSAFC